MGRVVSPRERRIAAKRVLVRLCKGRGIEDRLMRALPVTYTKTPVFTHSSTGIVGAREHGGMSVCGYVIDSKPSRWLPSNVSSRRIQSRVSVRFRRVLNTGNELHESCFAYVVVPISMTPSSPWQPPP